jgi:type VI secretion system protein
MARGLMQRLGGAAGAPRGSSDEQRSILEHLRALLNTRRGDSEAAPDFGIPDFTDYVHSVPSGLLQLQTALQQTIARYEPRLTQVLVRAVDVDSASLVLYFEVSARIVGAREKQVMRFFTRVVRGGRILVE